MLHVRESPFFSCCPLDPRRDYSSFPVRPSFRTSALRQEPENSADGTEEEDNGGLGGKAKAVRGWKVCVLACMSGKGGTRLDACVGERTGEEVAKEGGKPCMSLPPSPSSFSPLLPFVASLQRVPSTYRTNTRES